MKTLLTLTTVAACCVLLLAGCGQPSKPAVRSEEAAPKRQDKYSEALAKLSPEDRKLAEEQKFCAVENESRLGGMGEPFKITLDGKTVFLCCKGCEKAAREKPEETLANVEKLKLANK